MITRPIILVILCYAILMIVQSFVPKAVALKRKPDVGGFMVEDQRTHKSHNYMMKRARNDVLGDKENVRPNPYYTEPFDPDTSPEELSALIVDYANMIRNDVILLDNSVETRTRKRGNIQVENQAIPDPPCTCKYKKEIEDLGENSVPRFIETRNCNKTQQPTCRPPYICKESLYSITILKRRETKSQESLEIPNELKYRWVAESHPVSVACLCTRDYQLRYNNN
ncbi:prothoracicotropic hormone preproprotein [Bombyx mori]|uniref:Prothoracicotropic hormone n=5 Tax=Bombyx TaxID=7090 RepID=PTTH_BOMMO|nr:prothoracicotropic hormone preproprotein [Bombyx mori]P17219.1 RecName: Full=Prothoracicotropic hormone; Short=PTTH; Contains: RecName: Full=P2K; Contains: RecName: Full=P6K; Contains: RecName: Full=Prothoracicotropic hormone; Flags: Precursor [Bombyx mori]BAA14119.1 unnamed protein product [Bombyx mori]CAA53543.1 preproPTTH [Bombyx mori]